MLETSTNDFIAAGGLGRRGRLGLGMLVAASCLVALGLGGCASTPSDSLRDGTGLSSDFGEALAHNMSAQFVPPTEAQKANTYIRPNAARQQLALKAYEDGLIELDNTATD